MIQVFPCISGIEGLSGQGFEKAREQKISSSSGALATWPLDHCSTIWIFSDMLTLAHARGFYGFTTKTIV
jgi:hypothetical protein